MRLRRAEVALLLGAALAVAAVAGFGLHRAGLYALPGDRIVVWFDAEVDTPAALRRIGQAGATLARAGPLPRMYSAYVIEPAAPRRLAADALVVREPVDGLAQCLGLATGGPGGT